MPLFSHKQNAGFFIMWLVYGDAFCVGCAIFVHIHICRSVQVNEWPALGKQLLTLLTTHFLLSVSKSHFGILPIYVLGLDFSIISV